MSRVTPGAPRESQTIRLPAERLESLQEWARESGVTAAARVRDSRGRIALVKNRWSEGWILPGGGVEPGEHPESAARREVREETGLAATVADPVVVLDQTYVGEDGTEWFSAEYVVYAARAEGEIPDSGLGTTEEEIAAARWFESVPEELHDGDVLRPYL